MIAQVYVGDIVFGSTSNTITDVFAQIMTTEFEMSMVGELSFFLGLQIKQFECGIFLSQTKYAHALLKKFGMESSKPSTTPMSTTLRLSLDADGNVVNETMY